MIPSSQDETKLTDNVAVDVFGSVAAFNGDLSLCGLFRAIVLNHSDSSDCKVLAEAMKMVAYQTWTQEDVDADSNYV